ncbi:MAG TPA: CoA-binding protein [Steroidobacteraceae bacterium]|jgi:acyl-CoA synthetase (NDP forming)
MGPLLRPRLIAVIGASAKPGSASSIAIRNLLTNGYSGSIHLVGRSGGMIDGRECLTSVNELPYGIDLAILITPAEAVADMLRDCAARGVKTAICFASGLAEMGEVGGQAQSRIKQLAQSGGISLIGPNTVGYFNYVDPLAIA